MGRFANPVLKVQGRNQGDPGVLKFNGVYYLYHTDAHAIPVYVSTDLVNWQEAGVAVRASDMPGHWAQVDLWAPEVVYLNGLFYMYVTGARLGADGHGDDAERHIGVAVSESPLGPFEWMDAPLTEEWSIDAHPFQDADGCWYLYYNVRNDYTRGPGGVIGTGNVVDRMLSMTELAGNPTFVVKPESLREGNREGSFFWNEGPFVIKREGVYHQMFSAGFFADETYALYVATAQTPMGVGGMLDRSWRKHHEPLLQTNESCLGPGHHVVVSGRNGVHEYVVYHGYEPEAGVGERRNYIGRLFWHDGGMWVEGPARELEQPWSGLVERFDREPGEWWEIKRGNWACTGAGQVEVRAVEQEACLLSRNLGWQEYVLETNVQMDGGVYAYYADERHWVKTWLYEEERCVMTSCVMDGREVERKRTRLAQEFLFEKWHLVRVVKNGALLQVFVDGRLMHAVDVSSYEEAGRVGLVAGGKAVFGHTCWVAHFEDDFVQSDGGWGGEVVEGRLVLEELERRVFLKGNRLEEYEVRCDASGSAAKFGLVAAYAEDGTALLVEVDVLRQEVAVVQRTAEGREVLERVMLEGACEAADRMRNLRCWKRKQEVVVFLDGREVMRVSHVMKEATRAGLFVEGGAAVFDNVSQTMTAYE